MEKRMLSPKEIAEATVKTGVAKANKTSLNLLLLGILAGAFIAFGSIGAIRMATLFKDPGAAKFMFAAVFPVGLMLVVLAGGELFTGNNLITLALMKKEIGWKGLAKNWSLVYIGNLIGSLIMAWMVVESGLFGSLTPAGVEGKTFADVAVKIAHGKMGLTFSVAFIRGILCNIIVVLAVWLMTGAKDMTGKIFACWFPVMLFVLSGYEHCIANMFFIPVAQMLEGSLNMVEMFTANVIPVTLGNIFGGGVIVPVFYYLIFLRDEKGQSIKSVEATSIKNGKAV